MTAAARCWYAPCTTLLKRPCPSSWSSSYVRSFQSTVGTPPELPGVSGDEGGPTGGPGASA
eukprot:CAMPEP_0198421270 /NCGR_PEP_ID=MMETSP1452-20131203/1522_1 /TAXON_ID=1181717 /ORGANISM="Synchroma pusillum, Strain CCMP3072" /LENGTH=60 /DNA_ID=CAMNT_0044141467 /DNA_START=21 /DNA_END=199 /DNA_ORIENTATION=-